jgi:hypothetical protein
MVDFIGERWPGTDEAHLAPEYIYELWQFIETEATHPTASTRNSWVGDKLENRLAVLSMGARRPQNELRGVRLMHRLVGADMHRPELEHGEHAAVLPYPLLAKQDRTARLQPNGKRATNKHWGQTAE